MPKVTVDSGKCDGCGACKDVCPVDVFETKSKAKVKNESDCIGCRACESQCPKNAIKVED